MDNKTLYKLCNAQKSLKWSEVFSLEPRKVKETNVLSFYVKTPIYPDFKADKVGDFLEGALNEVVKNNDALRIRIIKTPKGMRQYVQDFEPLNVERIRIDGDSAFDEILPHLDRYPIDWFDERLVLAKLFILSDDRCAFLLRFHHAIFDGFSIKLFFEQFIKVYHALMNGEDLAENSVRNPSLIQYLQEDEKYFQSPQYGEDRKYWIQKFCHQRHYRMPAGRRHPCGDCDNLSLTFSGEDYQNIVSAAQQCSCSFQSFFMSMAAIATYILTKKDNFCFYSLTHGRRKYQYKKCIGCMMNTVPVFFDFNDLNRPIKDIVTDCYADFIEALQHAQFPMGEQIPISYMESVKNLFNFNHGWLLFSTMDYESIKSLSELEIVDLPFLNQPYQFYLSVLDTHKDSVVIRLHYQIKKYKKDTIVHILNTYEKLCKTVCENTDISINELCKIINK